MSNCPSYFHILQYVQVLSGLNYYFFSFRVHRHTHTDGHEYSIVAADKPQLSLFLTSLCGCKSTSNSVASPGII